MIPFMSFARAHPEIVQDYAQSMNPACLADVAQRTEDGFSALCSIAARGHWMLVNGHWLRKQPDGVHL